MSVSGSMISIKKERYQHCVNQEPNGSLSFFKDYRAAYVNMVSMVANYSTVNQNILSIEDKFIITKQIIMDSNKVYNIINILVKQL